MDQLSGWLQLGVAIAALMLQILTTRRTFSRPRHHSWRRRKTVETVWKIGSIERTHRVVTDETASLD
jgi:hypothetical protein